MTDIRLNLYQFGQMIDSLDNYAGYDDYEDEDYYGLTDDGWARPGPCPVCGVIDWACVTDAHYTYTPEEIAYVTQI